MDKNRILYGWIEAYGMYCCMNNTSKPMPFIEYLKQWIEDNRNPDTSDLQEVCWLLGSLGESL